MKQVYLYLVMFLVMFFIYNSYVILREPLSNTYKGCSEVTGSSDPTCDCLLYTSPSPRDRTRSRMPSSA